MSLGMPQLAPGADQRQFEFGEVWLLQGDAHFADDHLFGNHDPKENRPVIIVQDGPLNKAWNYPLIRIAPITTEVAVLQPTDIELTRDRDGVKHTCFVRLGHVQAVLKNDLQHPLTVVSEEALKEIMATELWLLGHLA